MIAAPPVLYPVPYEGVALGWVSVIVVKKKD